MNDSTHTAVYALVMGVVCALLLTGVKEVTYPYAESNRKAERIRHVFGVLGVKYDKGLSSQDLVALDEKYRKDKTIREEPLGKQTKPDGTPTMVYVYAPADADPSTHRKAVEFAGSGLWAPIKGFLALNMDMTEIRGVTFHEQEETPGLGGEITTKAFCDGFIGKKLEDANDQVGISFVAKGTARKNTNDVDGITSATLTCDKVEAMLNRVIATIIKERKSNG